MMCIARPAGPKPQRRRGMSLIEVVVTIGVATVMLGLAVMTIHLLLRAERDSTRSVWENTTITRLSRTLRDDVHAARTAEVTPAAEGNPASLILTFGRDPETDQKPAGRRITYEATEHQLTRVETDGETVRRRNTFYLPAGGALQFQRAPGAPVFVRLLIERRPSRAQAAEGAEAVPSAAAATWTLTIEAMLSRSNRFEAGD